MSVRPTHAVVTLGALDLRPEPDHRAELASQLLLGETVRLIGRAKQGWQRVENLADGYRGWVKEWGLVPAEGARVARWRAKARARVCIPMAVATMTPQGPGAVGPVFFGAALIASPSRSGVRAVEFPDGRRGYLPAAALKLGDRPAMTLAQRVATLLGTPYLWGGRTPAGYDCSGLVQQVLREQGVLLPRDAHEQYRASRIVARPEEVVEGDLIFFRANGKRMQHVGLALGGGFFAHARGRVRVATLDSDNALCDKELVPQFECWARPILRHR